MRYKNLSITITLGCLSLVALAALVMLPITDVISCSGNDAEWHKNNNNTLANFYAYHKYSDQNDMGWGVYAEIEVSINENGYGVSSANVTPRIVDPDRMRKLWEQDKTVTSVSYYGNVTAKASVFPYYFNHKYGSAEAYKDDSSEWGDTFLSVAAVEKTTTYRKIAFLSEENTVAKTKKVEVQAGMSTSELVSFIAELSLSVTGTLQWTDTNKKVWSVTVSTDITETIFKQGQTAGKSAYFTGSGLGGKASASVSGFDMYGCCFDSQSVYLQLDDPYYD